MDEFELYKGLYSRELERRVDLDTKINVPISAITILFSIMFYLITKTYIEDCTLRTLYYLFMALSAGLLLVGLAYLVKSYNNFFKGNAYDAFPEAEEIRNYQKELEKHYANNIAESTRAFNEYLLSKYIKYATDAVRVNDRRTNEIHVCRMLVILAMCCTLIAACITGISIIGTN